MGSDNKIIKLLMDRVWFNFKWVVFVEVDYLDVMKVV